MTQTNDRLPDETKTGAPKRALRNARVCHSCGATITDGLAIDCHRCGSTEITDRHSRPIYTPPLERRSLGMPFCTQFSPGGTILLSGNKGAGKTTSCMRLFELDEQEIEAKQGLRDPDNNFRPYTPKLGGAFLDLASTSLYEVRERLEKVSEEDLAKLNGLNIKTVDAFLTGRFNGELSHLRRSQRALRKLLSLPPNRYRKGDVRPGRWISSEQEVEQIKDSWYRTHGKEAEPPNVAYVYTWEDLLEELIGVQEKEIVVVDSITQLGASTHDANVIVKGCIEAIRRGQSIGVFIAQYTKDGSVAGPNMLGHMVDGVARILRGKDGLRRFTWDKNRMGDEVVTYFTITDRGIERQSWPYAYSVEGPAGAYELRIYPSKGTTHYAGLLDLIKDQGARLPELGVATAAIVSSIYPGGYAEPVDILERKKFAQENGLTWLEPEEVFELLADSEKDR